MPDITDVLQDIESAVREVESAVREVESSVDRVKRAVEEKWSWLQWLGAAVIGMYVSTLPGTFWHSKWRYGMAYGIPSDKVRIDKHPHDCAFFSAPLGYKHCHYERTVSTLWWATSKAGSPLVSYDEGKTWSVFAPDNTAGVPQYPTVEEVYITWDKKDDDD